MTKVIVCGDRHWKDREYIFTRLDEMRSLYGIEEVIEGCAKGADRFAEEWALDRGLHLSHFPAEWSKYGPGAGNVRNRKMMREGKPHMVIAFHAALQQSKGTKDMVDVARKAGVETHVFPHSHEGYKK